MVHLELRNIKKFYGSKKILDGITLGAKRGDMILIEGPSGIGKTTLLNIITGIDLPDEGDVIIDGKNIVKMNEDQRAKYRLMKIGIVFQQSNLIEDLNVEENIALPLKLAGKKWKDRVDELLRYLKLEHVRHQFPNSLSGGEQQRVAIARAIANKPEILVADEPTSNLDDENTEKIVEMFRDINRTMNTTIVIASHDPRMESLNAKRYVLKEGKLYER